MFDAILTNMPFLAGNEDLDLVPVAAAKKNNARYFLPFFTDRVNCKGTLTYLKMPAPAKKQSEFFRDVEFAYRIANQ